MIASGEMSEECGGIVWWHSVWHYEKEVEISLSSFQTPSHLTLFSSQANRFSYTMTDDDYQLQHASETRKYTIGGLRRWVCIFFFFFFLSYLTNDFS